MITGQFFAQEKTPPAPMSTEKTVGPGGRPTSPIDTDLWILIAVSVIFIAFFAMKYRKKVATN